MANTNLLKTVVEPELIRLFAEKYKCRVLDLSRTQLKYVFSEMEPDLVAVDNQGVNLYIGEITTSGYLGQRGGDFHIGAARKVTESFAKFYLYKLDSKTIFERLSRYESGLQLTTISNHFIVPQGARFLRALGYRERFLTTENMQLDELILQPRVKNIMMEVLNNSKNEMEKT